MTKFRNLEKKSAVSIESGKVLGKITDAAVDDSGKIISVKITKKKLGEKPQSFILAWSDIVNAENDVVLVKGDCRVPIAESSEGGILSAIKNYAPYAVLLISVLLLIKSCTG